MASVFNAISLNMQETTFSLKDALIKIGLILFDDCGKVGLAAIR